MIRFTPYAEGPLNDRGLARSVVEAVVREPEQVLEEGHRKIAQGRYRDARKGKQYLVRVIYEETGDDILVITAYQTSKIAKYWRGDEDSV